MKCPCFNLTLSASPVIEALPPFSCFETPQLNPQMRLCFPRKKRTSMTPVCTHLKGDERSNGGENWCQRQRRQEINSLVVELQGIRARKEEETGNRGQDTLAQPFKEASRPLAFRFHLTRQATNSTAAGSGDTDDRLISERRKTGTLALPRGLCLPLLIDASMFLACALKPKNQPDKLMQPRSCSHFICLCV